MADLATGTWASLSLGVALGVAIVVVLQRFPGEPFDYSPHNGRETDTAEHFAGATPVSSSPSSPQSLRRRRRDKDQDADEETERAERIERIQKLQALLGLEEAAVQSMMRTPTSASSSSTNYMAWADKIVYLVLFGILCYVAERDYHFKVLDLLAYLFPREAATLRQLSAPWAMPIHAAP
ncbi:hypothetical protein ACHHYP_07107 [Achlya hypogyna]|uniref:Uncharacterized protein n=1 Tax=Achlya hypogyna TaxID=1202772 RepID=A0A1V9ZMQ1_ACHHY|nr:hypothetical protein ACHHYP_07107 [Achlya hypogyna]